LYAIALRETIEEYGLEAKFKGDIIVSKMWNRTIAGEKRTKTTNFLIEPTDIKKVSFNFDRLCGWVKSFTEQFACKACSIKF
jgi:hypothetical protein